MTFEGVVTRLYSRGQENILIQKGQTKFDWGIYSEKVFDDPNRVSKINFTLCSSEQGAVDAFEAIDEVLKSLGYKVQEKE